MTTRGHTSSGVPNPRQQNPDEAQPGAEGEVTPASAADPASPGSAEATATTGAGAPASPPAGPASRGHRPVGISVKEIAAYSSTFLALMCLIKVYGVARYSSTTTASLITTAPEQVVLGTLAIYVYPTVAMLAYATTWFAVIWRRVIHREAWPLVFGVILICALMTPVSYHVWAMGLLIGSLVIEVLARRLSVRRPRTRFGIRGTCRRLLLDHSFVYLGGVALLFGFLHTLTSPWTSAEVFVTKEPVVTATQRLQDGASGPVQISETHAPFTGYVIDESLTSYTILNADTRYVMQLEKSVITARYPCHNEGDQLRGREPLFQVLLGHRYESPNAECGRLITALSTASH